MPREKRRYLQMLSRFLVDKKRSQGFSVDGGNYAWAALRYLEHISSARWVFSSGFIASSWTLTFCDNSEISEAQMPSSSRQWPNGDAEETQLEYIQLLLSKAAPLQVLAVFLTDSPACQSLQTASNNQALDTFAQQINKYLEVEVPIFT